MAVEHVVGNLFDLKIPVISQGTNLEGRMGAGIALSFQKKFPLMYQEYKLGCHFKRFQLGDFFFYDHQLSGFKIYNLMTQPRPGPCASLNAIYNSILNMAEH